MTSKLQDKNIDRQLEQLHTQAVIQHKKNKLDIALSLYLQSIKLNELQPEWIYGNAIIVSAQIGQIETGIELIETAEKIYSESEEICRAAGILFHKSNNERKAIECYLKAIYLNNRQPEWLYIKLIDLLIAANYYEQAAEITNLAVQQFPSSETIEKYLEIITAQNSNGLRKNVFYTDAEKSILFAKSQSRETPPSIERCVDININNLRRQLMDSAIIDKYQILLNQLLCNIHEGTKQMDVDALVHCLAEIKTDIHYLKTKLLDPPAEAVDPQAKKNVKLEKIIALNKPVPIKCELTERIVGSGWHASEEHGRWTGPGVISSVVLPYPAEGKYKFEMIVRSEAKLGLLDTLKININDRPLSNLNIKRKDSVSFPVIVRGDYVVSLEESSQSFLAVDLIIEETVNLQEADTRLIGLLIEKISLIPFL